MLVIAMAWGIAAGGKVSKIGADYVGLLVLGVLNAAIGRQNIRSDLVYMPLVRTDVMNLERHMCMRITPSELMPYVLSQVNC